MKMPGATDDGDDENSEREGEGGDSMGGRCGAMDGDGADDGCVARTLMR